MLTRGFQIYRQLIQVDRRSRTLLIFALFSIVVGCRQTEDFSLPPALPAHTPDISVVSMSEDLINPAIPTATHVTEPTQLTAVPTKVSESKQSPLMVTVTYTISVTVPAMTITPAASIPTMSPVILITDSPTLSPTLTATLTPTLAASTESNELVGEIGKSFQGRPIKVHKFGNGPNRIIFVGGIHGGYEWNTILLVYKMIEYFQEYPEAVPETITLFIVPSANPDGQVAVTGKEGEFTRDDVFSDTIPGRLNGNHVDLNRNWDCQWAPTAIWRQEEVSGGSGPFSEPETQALRSFIEKQQPQAVIFWHSKANGVFAADCPDDPRPTETHLRSFELAQLYGSAAGYPVYEYFTSYPVTGDAGDWLTKVGITSITVELKTHEGLDWPQNLDGILAVLDYYK